MYGHGGEKKLDKKIKKYSIQAYFAIHVHNEKTQEMCGDGHGGQRGSCGENEGKEETCGTIYMDISKEITKKRTTAPKNMKTSKLKWMKTSKQIYI